MGAAHAQSIGAPSCIGVACTDKNPVEYGCDLDAYVEDEITATVFRWQDGWQPQVIVVQKMYSVSCQANWSRAFIPADTYLFIQELNLADNNQPARGMIQATGTGYFWADSHMSNGAIVNQACAALPIFSSGSGHDLYDRHCTNLN